MLTLREIKLPHQGMFPRPWLFQRPNQVFPGKKKVSHLWNKKESFT